MKGGNHGLMSKLIDLTGSKFGNLVVLERSGKTGRKVMWKCLSLRSWDALKQWHSGQGNSESAINDCMPV